MHLAPKPCTVQPKAARHEQDDLLVHERLLWRAGVLRVAGVDEAGRGPWAGPVVAAGVLMPPNRAERLLRTDLLGLTDSKQLCERDRDRLFLALTENPDIRWSVAQVDAADIDRLRIHRATHKAMALALSGLRPCPAFALVDGLPVPGLPCPSEALVRGDARSMSIAAASVIAKVTRDRIMRDADAAYPGYGFARHKGYGTAAHREALHRLGPCALHRRSFAPVAAATGPSLPLP